MDYSGFHIKDSSLSCNCPWMGCAAHPQALCQAQAAAVTIDGDNPDHEHYIGDASLAGDIHLCVACSEVLLNVFGDEILTYMQDITRYVPDWMRPLETLCRKSYIEHLTRPNPNGGGWMRPQNDALAILTLAFLVLQQDPGGADAIPTAHIVRLTVLREKVQSIIDAFKMDGQHVGVSE